MKREKLKAKRQLRRKRSVRHKIFGTPERPRLSVSRSNRQISAQLIDDLNGVTICSAGTREKSFDGKTGNSVNCEIAGKVGQALAEKARMEMTVNRGRSYITADENKRDDEEREVGVIAVDSLFSPVTRVRYRVEDTRVGQRTNYDRLVLDIWTNGTLTPEMSLVEAAKILRKHLNPFVQYFDLGNAMATMQRRRIS